MEPDMLVPLINSQIYAALEKLLIPAKLPASWDAVTFPGYGETAPGSESYLAALTAEFALADLAAAGVVIFPTGSDAQPELHPDLQVAGRKWLACEQPRRARRLTSSRIPAVFPAVSRFWPRKTIIEFASC